MSELKSRPYRGVNKEDRIAQRRSKLVASGIQLFGSQGFSHTSIKALCVNVGLTERSFYESFGNKEELLIACYNHLRANTLQQVRQAALSAPATPGARNLAGVSTYFRLLRSDAAAARLLLFELEGISASTNETVRSALQEASQLVLDILGKELTSQPRGGLNPELLASGWMGAVYQLAKIWVHSGYAAPEEEMVRNSHALFLGMMTLWAIH